jgi:hypothetical protein
MLELDRRQFMLGVAAGGLTLTVAPGALIASRPVDWTRFAVLEDLAILSVEPNKGGGETLECTLEQGDIVWINMNDDPNDWDSGILRSWADWLKSPAMESPFITDNPSRDWLALYGDRWAV